MPDDPNAPGFTEVEFSIPSMVCDGCAERIRDTLALVSGVHEVKPNLWRRRVWVRYDRSSLSKEKISSALGAAGFIVTEA